MEDFKYMKVVRAHLGGNITFLSEELPLQLVKTRTYRFSDSSMTDMFEVLFGLGNKGWQEVSETKYKENISAVKLFYPEEYRKFTSGEIKHSEEHRSLKVMPNAVRKLYQK